MAIVCPSLSLHVLKRVIYYALVIRPLTQDVRKMKYLYYAAIITYFHFMNLYECCWWLSPVRHLLDIKQWLEGLCSQRLIYEDESSIQAMRHWIKSSSHDLVKFDVLDKNLLMVCCIVVPAGVRMLDKMFWRKQEYEIELDSKTTFFLPNGYLHKTTTFLPLW